MASSIEQVSGVTENLVALVEQNSTAMEESTRSIQGVTKNAQEITDTAMRISNTVNQLDRSIRSVAGLARQTEETSQRTVRDAEEGGSAVEKAIHGLGRVRDSMSQSAGVIKQMGKRADEITGIVDTINLIAERTNLLSLNASIEAARTGEAGRGFAVVAEKIRNLADRSAQATSEIAGIIKALQEVVNETIATSNNGQRIAEESGHLAEEGLSGLKKILTGINNTVSLVTKITTATTEQITLARGVVEEVNNTTAQAKHVANAMTEQAKTTEAMLQTTR